MYIEICLENTLRLSSMESTFYASNRIILNIRGFHKACMYPSTQHGVRVEVCG